MAKRKTTTGRRTATREKDKEAEVERLELGAVAPEAQEDVSAQVEISSVIALPPATVKTLYESNADTNAFDDAAVAKLAGIEANATADQTGAEIVTAIDTELGQTDWQNGGGGGGLSRSVDNPAAIGDASIQIVRLGGASAATFGGSAAAGYDVVMPAGAEATQFDFFGNSTTTNASGEVVIRFDNSANGYDRRFSYQVFDRSNGQKVDEHLVGTILDTAIAGNITTLTIPNIQGNFPNGVDILFR